jgi:hypothetical protein
MHWLPFRARRIGGIDNVDLDARRWLRLMRGLVPFFVEYLFDGRLLHFSRAYEFQQDGLRPRPALDGPALKTA